MNIILRIDSQRGSSTVSIGEIKEANNVMAN